MDRLTMRNSDGSVSQPMDLQWAEALHRLATYEDTGMRPRDVEEIARYREHIFSTWSYNHMAEIAAAEQSERLIVLPCKVGDEVYVLVDGNVKEEVVKMFFSENDGWSFHTLGDFCGGVYRFSDVGKRVFLSHEEAAATLDKKEKENLT